MSVENQIVLRDNEGKSYLYRVEAMWANTNPLWPVEETRLCFLVGQKASVWMDDRVLALKYEEAKKLNEWLTQYFAENPTKAQASS